MNELDRLEFDMLVRARDPGEMGEEFRASMFSLWDQQYATAVTEEYQTFVGPAGVRPDASPFETEITDIEVASPDCLHVHIRREVATVFTQEALPPGDGTFHVILFDGEPDPLNPTRWRYAFTNNQESSDGCNA